MINPVISELIELPADFCFEYRDDVFSIMERSFKNRLDSFMKNFTLAHPGGNIVLTPAQIRKFPFIEDQNLQHEVFTRKQDLHMLEKLVKNIPKNRAALEIGGWNGWLSKCLTSWGFNVISTDIFRDESFGLSAKQFQNSTRRWVSIQTDITSPSIYKKKFNLIVVNHCLQFMPDPDKVLDAYYELLVPGGLLVVLGIDYRNNESLQKTKVQALRDNFFTANGFNLNFYPSKGYADAELIRFFKKRSYTFISYKLSAASRILKKLKRDHCGIYYLQKGKST